MRCFGRKESAIDHNIEFIELSNFIFHMAVKNELDDKLE